MEVNSLESLAWTPRMVVCISSERVVVSMVSGSPPIAGTVLMSQTFLALAMSALTGLAVTPSNFMR